MHCRWRSLLTCAWPWPGLRGSPLGVQQWGCPGRCQAHVPWPGKQHNQRVAKVIRHRDGEFEVVKMGRSSDIKMACMSYHERATSARQPEQHRAGIPRHRCVLRHLLLASTKGCFQTALAAIQGLMSDNSLTVGDEQESMQHARTQAPPPKS
eukprot:648410-Pelagomonas_calceolata.AAC.7